MERWGWSNTKIETYLNLLVEQGMLLVKSDTKKTVITIVNYDFYQGDGDKKRRETDTKTKRNRTNNNDNNVNKNIYVEIIGFLNEKAGTNFKHSTNKTRDLIKARLNEGFTINDFKTVIEYCCKE